MKPNRWDRASLSANQEPHCPKRRSWIYVQPDWTIVLIRSMASSDSTPLLLPPRNDKFSFLRLLSSCTSKILEASSCIFGLSASWSTSGRPWVYWLPISSNSRCLTCCRNCSITVSLTFCSSFPKYRLSSLKPFSGLLSLESKASAPLVTRDECFTDSKQIDVASWSWMASTILWFTVPARHSTHRWLP